jgi:hypothetical protein
MPTSSLEHTVDANPSRNQVNSECGCNRNDYPDKSTRPRSHRAQNLRFGATHFGLNRRQLCPEYNSAGMLIGEVHCPNPRTRTNVEDVGYVKGNWCEVKFAVKR